MEMRPTLRTALQGPTRPLNSAAREVRCSRTVERLTLAVTSMDHGGEAAGRWRGRLPIVAGVLVALLVLLALAVYLYDHSRRDLIAKGVRIDGIAVGGLHEAAARAKLERDIVQRLDGPVVVHAAGHTWTLTGRSAGVKVDVQNMVQQALDASREGSII